MIQLFCFGNVESLKMAVSTLKLDFSNEELVAMNIHPAVVQLIDYDQL